MPDEEERTDDALGELAAELVGLPADRIRSILQQLVDVGYERGTGDALAKGIGLGYAKGVKVGLLEGWRTAVGAFARRIKQGESVDDIVACLTAAAAVWAARQDKASDADPDEPEDEPDLPPVGIDNGIIH